MWCFDATFERSLRSSAVLPGRRTPVASAETSASPKDLERFSLAHYERFANHFGAPLPHPGLATRLRSPSPAVWVQSNVVGYWRPGQPAGASYQPDEWHTDIDYEVCNTP